MRIVLSCALGLFLCGATTASARVVFESSAAQFAAGTTTGAADTRLAPGSVVLVPDDVWLDVGQAPFLALEKNDGRFSSAPECPESFLGARTVQNDVPFATGPFDFGGTIAGLPGGTVVPAPTRTALVRAVHMLHPGGRCGEQSLGVTFTYSDGGERAVTTAIANDCENAPHEEAFVRVTSLGNYGAGYCCDNWYESRFQNPEPARTVASMRVDYQDACGGALPGQIWALSLELPDAEYLRVRSAPTEGTYVSIPYDTGFSSVATSISATATLPAGATLELAVRAAATEAELASATFTVAQSDGRLRPPAHGRFVQMRARLLGRGALPVLRDLSLSYESAGAAIFESTAAQFAAGTTSGLADSGRSAGNVVVRGGGTWRPVSQPPFLTPAS